MVTLLLGIHDHQPVGNFGDVLERAYRSAYRPFLDVVEKHPAVKVNLHHSGILYEWLEEHHPEYLQRVGKLVAEGRVELLGGGFYEPILAALPEKDQQGQIAKMSAYLRGRFGVEAQGLWLAERVWEPQLPKVLAKAGIRYTVLDDTHFHAVGFADSELRGHYLTEAEGASVRVFPISQRLRYLMPYAAPEEVVAFLRRAEEEAGGRDVALVMADDGEKFGLWPRTHERCYEEGWLDRFFSLCARNSSWLQVRTFSERLAAAPPLGWAYLPTTSYSELSEWALPEASSRELGAALRQTPEESKRFLRGGYFRNFLSKYPEANRLYRKMLRVSAKVHAVENGKGRAKKAPEGLDAALGHLWKGQCNCAYWHGVFGGLYLPHLRRAVYENLVKAEAQAERVGAKAKGALAPFSMSADDWDGDGVDELLIDGPAANWYLSRKGGGLWEWDLKPSGANLGGVVSRRKEAYHEKIRQAEVARAGMGSIHDAVVAKETGLDRELCYDWHPRMSLLDHFLHPDTHSSGFASASYGEQGDFVLAEYAATKPELDNGNLRMSLEREGTVWVHSRAVSVRVRKELRFTARGGWGCRYSLENRTGEAADVWFGFELAFAFSTAAAAPAGEELGVAVKTLRDEHLGLALKLRLEAPMDLWSFPLYTISQSEEGFEKTYQGSVLLLHKRMTLLPGVETRLGVVAEAES